MIKWLSFEIKNIYNVQMYAWNILPWHALCILHCESCKNNNWNHPIVKRFSRLILLNIIFFLQKALNSANFWLPYYVQYSNVNKISLKGHLQWSCIWYKLGKANNIPPIVLLAAVESMEGRKQIFCSHCNCNDFIHDR